MVAGDLTFKGQTKAIRKIFRWLREEVRLGKFKHAVVVAGNHDRDLQDHPLRWSKLFPRYPKVHYLQDSSITLEGYRFWGSPWVPWFGGHWAFEKKRGWEIFKKWELIPNNTEILVTHTPPIGILDDTYGIHHSEAGAHAGCKDLRNVVLWDVRPKLHVFGHIHTGRGRMDYEYSNGTKTIFVNPAACNAEYDPLALRPPIVVDLPSKLC